MAQVKPIQIRPFYDAQAQCWRGTTPDVWETGLISMLCEDCNAAWVAETVTAPVRHVIDHIETVKLPDTANPEDYATKLAFLRCTA